MDLGTGIEVLTLGLGAAIIGLVLLMRIDTRSGLRCLLRKRIAWQVMERLPFPIWVGRQAAGRSGSPLWANEAFLGLTEQDREILIQSHGRLALDCADGVKWFQRSHTGEIGYALPCDDLVRAEDGQRDMLQTMTQAFAQLPLGLALFDRTRHLSSFNPALSELTGLSPAFLSRKPSLGAMLDAMRDRNMVPEPRNWKDWRAGLFGIDRADSMNAFDEVWALPGGQTYRVTGRHHKGGGLTLMIEDISSEIIQGRRYRASLALCQGVIDHLDEGIAVFAASGQLVLSNLAYSILWGNDPVASLSRVDLSQVAQHWRAGSAPTGLWGEMEEFVGSTEDRSAWQGEARLNDGRLIRCRIEPLMEGATLITFRTISADGPPRAITAESA